MKADDLLTVCLLAFLIGWALALLLLI